MSHPDLEIISPRLRGFFERKITSGGIPLARYDVTSFLRSIVVYNLEIMPAEIIAWADEVAVACGIPLNPTLDSYDYPPVPEAPDPEADRIQPQFRQPSQYVVPAAEMPWHTKDGKVSKLPGSDGTHPDVTE